MLNILKSLIGGGAPAEPVTWVEDVTSGRTILIDVRGHDETKRSGKAKGAIVIPLQAISQEADPKSGRCHKMLSVDKPVLVYCASGMRSGQAARQLTAMGYSDVTNIGGLNAWVRAGGEVVR